MIVQLDYFCVEFLGNILDLLESFKNGKIVFSTLANRLNHLFWTKKILITQYLKPHRSYSYRVLQKARTWELWIQKHKQDLKPYWRQQVLPLCSSFPEPDLYTDVAAHKFLHTNEMFMEISHDEQNVEKKLTTLTSVAGCLVLSFCTYNFRKIILN